MLALVGGDRTLALTGATVAPARREGKYISRETHIVVSEFARRTGLREGSARNHLDRMRGEFPLAIQSAAARQCYGWIARFTAPTEAALATVSPPQFELALLAAAAHANAEAQYLMGRYLVTPTETAARVAIRALLLAAAKFQAIAAALAARHGLRL